MGRTKQNWQLELDFAWEPAAMLIPESSNGQVVEIIKDFLVTLQAALLRARSAI